MLSYRHGFHAGCFADVHKHAILIGILAYLQQKAKPFSYIDTHAGSGEYPTALPFMQKNQEYQNGIGKLFNCQGRSELLQRYLAVIQQFNPEHEFLVYPGSPCIARTFLSQQDRMHAMELHPSDFATLQTLFKRDKRVKVHQLNAFTSLAAFVPPPMKRGLIMIDPSYELADEYEQLINMLVAAHTRFSTGIYAIWYPIVQRSTVNWFIQTLKKTKIPNIFRCEISIQPDQDGYGMTGSGMLLINPPYTLPDQIVALQQDLKILLPLVSSTLTKL